MSRVAVITGGASGIGLGAARALSADGHKVALLDRTRNIRLSEEHHGPAGDRRFHYEPTWILRGLTSIHLEFDVPAEAPK